MGMARQPSVSQQSSLSVNPGRSQIGGRRSVSQSQQAALSQHEAVSSRKHKTYAEQIAGQFLPSKREMREDRAATNEMTRRMVELDERLVQVAAEVTSALFSKDKQNLASDPDLLQLQLREKALQVEEQQIEVDRKRHESEHRKQNANAFARAQMIQDFLKSGLTYEQALEATSSLLGAPAHQANDS